MKLKNAFLFFALLLTACSSPAPTEGGITESENEEFPVATNIAEEATVEQ